MNVYRDTLRILRRLKYVCALKSILGGVFREEEERGFGGEEWLIKGSIT